MDNNFRIVLNAAKYKPSNTSTIEKDAEGYYKVRLGAFNVFNSSGAFYTAKGIEDLINNPNSFFRRRIKKGYLLGEMDHPKFISGMSMAEFMNRNAGYDMNNVAFHIKEVELQNTDDKCNIAGNYGNVVIVLGWIKPSGPKGEFLREALETKDRNVAFSVRSLSRDEVVNGIVIKHTTAILTWDWVTEPGINNANTFDMLNEKNINTESVNNMLTLNIKESDIADMVNVKTAVNQEANSEDIKILSNSLKRQFSSKPINKVLTW